ncbi:unnamed protein product, partial [Meganyctiphanes norvegica]
HILLLAAFALSMGQESTKFYTTDGIECVIPFTYNGETHNACAPGTTGPSWCPTQLMDDGITFDHNVNPWGRCRVQEAQPVLTTTEQPNQIQEAQQVSTTIEPSINSTCGPKKRGCRRKNGYCTNHPTSCQGTLQKNACGGDKCYCCIPPENTKDVTNGRSDFTTTTPSVENTKNVTNGRSDFTTTTPSVENTKDVTNGRSDFTTTTPSV